MRSKGYPRMFPDDAEYIDWIAYKVNSLTGDIYYKTNGVSTIIIDEKEFNEINSKKKLGSCKPRRIF